MRSRLAIAFFAILVVTLVLFDAQEVYAPAKTWSTVVTMKCNGLPSGFEAQSIVALTVDGNTFFAGTVSCKDSNVGSASFETLQRPNDWHVQITIFTNNNNPPTIENVCSGLGAGVNNFPGSVTCPSNVSGSVTAFINKPSR